jgi:hypothetical protein
MGLVDQGLRAAGLEHDGPGADGGEYGLQALPRSAHSDQQGREVDGAS